MNPPIRCSCCSREIRDWVPYRVQDRLFITFRHCGLAHMIEARFEVAKGAGGQLKYDSKNNAPV